MIEIDEFARRMAIERFALPTCLHIPVAARDEAAIRTHVGRVVDVITRGDPNNALLVEVEPPERNLKLPIWQIPSSEELHSRRQLWVHMDFRGYRAAYSAAFPENAIGDRVLDHVMNRRVARLKGFNYLRIVPISRAANSSSGGLSEKWAVSENESERMRIKNSSSPARIQYADLADIVKMLDLKTGGALQDQVNEAQALVRERPC